MRNRHSLTCLALAASMTLASFAAAQQSSFYGYDALGRLTRVARCGNTSSANTAAYQYDSAGNRNNVTTASGPSVAGGCGSKQGTDFNNDGYDDVLWRNSSGAVTNWLGTAAGGFVSNDVNAWVVVGLEWTIVGTGDFNGDGRGDILWRRNDGRLTTWHGSGNGGWIDNHAAAWYQVDLSWRVTGTGDFNGDGRTDILWRQTGGALSIWLGQSGPTFFDNGALASVVVPIAWAVAGTGDFDGDGRSDVLWRHTNGDYGVWLGQPNGTLTNAPAGGGNVDPNWRISRTGDFNGDGRDDILWRHVGGHLSTWLAGTTSFWIDNYAIANVYVPTSWSVVDDGDYNGDGRHDILWRNSNGDLTNWLGNRNGSFTPNDANAYTPVPTSWQVQGY